MRVIGKTAIAILAVMGLSAITNAAPVPGAPAPAFTGTDTKGNTVNLADFRGQKVMLEWTNHQCPYVRKHYESGNMQKTQRALTEEGVVWISVISSSEGQQGHVTASEADQLTASRGAYADMVLLDSEGKIGRAYDASTTPQMFLIDEEGVLQYMGAIDDRPSANPTSLDGATNYVLKAWSALKTGDEISPKSTKPYGCSVKYAM